MEHTERHERIAELEALIPRYQSSYYNGESEITDAEFDLLWDELKQIAPDSPVLAKIGADGTDETIADGFPKAAHLIPMGSQDKAANPEEFRAWAVKTNAPVYVVQHKLDGASLELQYEKSRLVRAVTRGNGIIGDEITRNALRMGGVLPYLNTSDGEEEFSGGVRGEVLMPHVVWKEKYADKANCRNAANGIMRRKDGEGCENLVFRAYDASAPNRETFFQNEIQKIAWLKERGFTTVETREFSDIEEIIVYREQVAAKRDNLDVDIDGLVIKDTVIDMNDLRRARPERQIAFKFNLETAYSILRDVEWSEAGVTYTPVGIIDPVRLAGTTVKRASLNNPGMIRALDLKIGAVVTVVKRGEIIPKIESRAPEGALPSSPAQETDVVFPTTCSSCGSALTDEDTRLYCPNPACPKLLLHRLQKWVKVLDIRDLGDKLLWQLFEKGRVRRIYDLYTLSEEELSPYFLEAQALSQDKRSKGAKKVLRNIQTNREINLAKFVAGFDFEGVGETIMDKICGFGFDTLEKLRTADAHALAIVEGIGGVTADTIVQGLKDARAEMDAVLATGIISIAPPPDDSQQPLKGLSFCFTGEMYSIKRADAEETIKKLGAQAKKSVVKGLSYLVTNDTESGSAKNKKALELGVPVIDEAAFIALVKSVANDAAETGAAEDPATPAQGELF